MKGEVRVTRRNWRHFEDIVDSLTLEKYKIGDRVLRCSQCSITFHAQYLEDKYCPGCNKEFIPAEIQTKVIRMKLDGDAAKRGIRKIVLAGSRFKPECFVRYTVKTLTAIGIIGLALSCGVWTWAAMNSPGGIGASLERLAVLLKSGAGSRIGQAAMIMLEPFRYAGSRLAGMYGGLEVIFDRYVLLADQFGRIAQLIGQTVRLLLEKCSIL